MITMCRTFGCLPSQLMAEDASIMRYLAIVALGTPDVDQQQPGVSLGE